MVVSKLAVSRCESPSDNTQFCFIRLRTLEAFIGQSGLRGRCSRKSKKVVGRDYRQVSHEMIWWRTLLSPRGLYWSIINDTSIEYIEIVNTEAFFSMCGHLWNCNKSNIYFIVAVNFCFTNNVYTSWALVYLQGGNFYCFNLSRTLSVHVHVLGVFTVQWL